jgi:glycosyltransferase involved in cell wall biosynthesis
MPKQYRILMASDRFLPIVGGAERQASQLITQLQARGHSVKVVTRRIHANLPQEEMLQGITIHRLSPVGLSHQSSALIVFSLWFFFMRQARYYDLIHAHTIGPVAVAAILAHLFTHKPVILKIASQGDVRREDGTKSRYSRFVRRYVLPLWLWRFLLMRASRIVTMSRALYQEAVDFGLTNVELIPNGVNVARFTSRSRHEARQALGLDAEKRYLVFTGRLVRLKRVDVLLDALPEILTQYPHCHALIVGSGEQQRESIEVGLHAQAERLGLTENIHFLGMREDIDIVLRAADVYVFTSEVEGLPNAILEAAAAQLPIVATRINGVTDILDDDNSWLVQVGDPSALAQAVCHALSNTTLAQTRALRAHQHVVSTFSLEAVVQRYEALYSTVVHGERTYSP